GVAFKLERDRARCSYTDLGAIREEEEQEKPERGADSRAATTAREEQDIERARHVLRSHPGIAGLEAWVLEMRINKTRARDAGRRLMTMGEVEERRERGRPRLFWKDPAASTALTNGAGM